MLSVVESRAADLVAKANFLGSSRIYFNSKKLSLKSQLVGSYWHYKGLREKAVSSLNRWLIAIPFNVTLMNSNDIM